MLIKQFPEGRDSNPSGRHACNLLTAPLHPTSPHIQRPNFETFKEPTNRFQAYVAWRAGARFLALIYCSKLQHCIRLCYLQPLGEQWFQLAHILEGEIEGLESRRIESYKTHNSVFTVRRKGKREVRKVYSTFRLGRQRGSEATTDF